MVINKETMLFEDASPSELIEMRQVAENLIFKSQYPDAFPRWLMEWMEIFYPELLTHYSTNHPAFPHNLTPLILATVLPQRLLLSIVYHQDNWIAEA